MAATGVDSLLPMTLKPGGSSVTLSPWLIQTSSRPWPRSLVAILDTLEECRMAAGTDLGVAELAFARTFDLAAQLLRHGLHAVADAQNRYAELEHALRRAPVLGLVNRVRTARKDDAPGLEFADERLADIERVQLAIHLLFAHAAGNQLRDLRAEIEDEDLLVGHIGTSLYSQKRQRRP